MYNEEKKLEFLASMKEGSYTDMSCNTYMYKFEKFSDTEELLKKDLYDFNYNDFKLLFERNKIINTNTMLNSKSIINRYIEWATKMGYCSSDTINELKRVISEDINPRWKIMTEMFADENDLLDCISSVMMEQDSSMIIWYQAFYGLYWNGLCNVEIYNLKKSDVQSNHIKVGDDIIIVSDRFAEIINEYKNMDSVVINDSVMPFAQSIYLIRAKNKKNSLGQINDNFHAQRRRAWDRMEVDIDNKYYGKVLVPTWIMRSGNFYRAYLDEQKGKEITSNNISDYFRVFAISNQKKIGYSTYRDYQNWKNVFYK